MNIFADGNKPGGNAYNSFDEFDRDFRSSVFRVCLQVLGNREDAEECSQDALFRMYKALPVIGADEEKSDYKGELSRENPGLRYWASKTAYRAALDYKRASRRLQGNEFALHHEKPLTQETLYIQSEEDRILRRILHAALSQLSTNMKETILAAWKDGFDYRQAAEEMGLSEGCLRLRVYRSRRALARLIKDRIQEDNVEITREMWYRLAKENPAFGNMLHHMF